MNGPRDAGRSALLIVGIADLGIGNFAAMAKMIDQLGAEARRLEDPSLVKSVDRLILPGVGAFDFAANMLDQRGWRDPLLDLMFAGQTPVLAVCVGMQLLASGSDEGPGRGLHWITGQCRRFQSTSRSPIKVPHMGWNTIHPTQHDPLLDSDGEQRFYFVHSYFVECPSSQVVAQCTYGSTYPAVIRRDLVWGVQFHPEKSHRYGLNLLKHFLELSC